MNGRLDGRIAVVTGGARGIGRAVSRRFAEEGALVYAIDVLGEELDAQIALWSGDGLRVRAIVADVGDEAAAAAAIRRVLEDVGRIDVLANVAGVIRERLIEETSTEDWDRMLRVNLRAPFLLCRAAAATLKAAGRGSVINVSSRAGAQGFATETAYCASKFGLEGFSRALAQEWGPHGIAVNTITPGTPVHTSMSETTYGPAQRAVWKDPVVVTPAFVHLALQTPAGLHDQYVNAWELSEKLRAEGWT
ncbi:MAG: SDR family NAD(P)-dependent oxidoreductase [bacterium]|nr:SDR family NAD(P)-dependent oxidoreductase [bacterium]